MESSLQLSLKLRVPSREHPHLGSVLQLDYPELINLQDISIFILCNNFLPKQTDMCFQKRIWSDLLHSL